MPYLSSNSQTIAEKIALISLKEMVPGLPLNFLFFLEELLTSMVYMGVEVKTCNEIYSASVKASATANVP